MKRAKKIDMETISSRLRDVSFKIRGIAYLLENQREHPVIPSSMEETFFGIGTLLAGLGQQVREISDEVDRWKLIQ